MRCSLLALSSYIDSELDIEPAGELEAHLVACERCRTAIGYLREESSRIGALARVHVPDDAAHDLFSQIGLIAEEDDLPERPVQRDRPPSIEAPPWFGAERGAALPWAPRPAGHEQSQRSQPRELMGERLPTTAVAELPELLLWDEPVDQAAPVAPVSPPVPVVLEPDRNSLPNIESLNPASAEPAVIEPQPPHTMATEPQPPDLSTSAPDVSAPRLAAGPSAFQRLRDAVAVRLALRRGASSHFGSDIEIVSGAGAPKWNERAHSKRWSESPPVVAAAPPVVEPLSAPAASKRAWRFLIPTEVEPVSGDAHPEKAAPASETTGSGEQEVPAAITAPLDLTDVLSEVASLAAPLGRVPAHVELPVETAEESAAEAHVDVPVDSPVQASAGPAAEAHVDVSVNSPVQTPADPAPVAPVDATVDPIPDDVLYTTSTAVEESWPARAADPEPMAFETTGSPFEAYAEPAAPTPGRHVRRLQSQRSERRQWNPTQPVTGRHVLPLGGPAVGAADRDRRLWLFGAVTVVVMLLGLLVGRQVTQTGHPVGATAPRSTPSVHASAPPSVAPSLPIATVAPGPTVVIPAAPTPAQLTGAKTLGTGSGGFTVADVRYGMHPGDFQLVFDLAYPNTVTGDPTTVIGYSGTTTLYVEFVGVNGAANVATMPPGQVVVSVVPLPQARNTSRLIFKITLSKHAPFDAYYLSGGRLVIDIT